MQKPPCSIVIYFLCMNLLIVDDEFYSRNNIRSIISANLPGSFEIKESEDGIFAMQALSSGFVPDIILADVRMPRMNGIDFAQNVRKIAPRCEIVFISGFSDKEYLKSAIRIGAIDYIEKPFSDKALLDAVKAAINRLRRSSESTGDDLQSLAVNQALSDFLSQSGQYESTSSILTRLGIIYPKHGQYCVIVYRPKGQTEWNPRIQEAIAQIPLFKSYTCFCNRLYASTIFSNDLPIVKATVQDCISHIIRQSPDYLSSGSFGVGSVQNSASSLPLSYSHAIDALNISFYHDESGAFYYRSTSEIKIESQSLLELKQFLDSMEYEKAIDFMEKITSEIRNSEMPDLNTVRSLYHRAGSLVYQHIESTFPSIPIPDDAEYWSRVHRAKKLSQLHEMILQELCKCLSATTSMNSTEKYIVLAKNIISACYSNYNLSCDYIAAQIGISGAYLSTIFKAITGFSLNRYINEYRIQTACKLLSGSQDSFTQIAAQVGYGNSSYFTKIFRKIMNCTPSDYRRDHAK